MTGDVFLVSPSHRNNLPLNKLDFSPRVGFAYSVDSKTVVRSGYGIFWIPDYVSFSLNPLNDMVNGGATTYTGTVDGTHPVNTIALPFPAGIAQPPGRSLGTMTCSTGHVSPVPTSQIIPSPPIGSLLNVSLLSFTELMAAHSNQFANISRERIPPNLSNGFPV